VLPCQSFDVSQRHGAPQPKVVSVVSRTTLPYTLQVQGPPGGAAIPNQFARVGSPAAALAHSPSNDCLGRPCLGRMATPTDSMPKVDCRTRLSQAFERVSVRDVQLVERPREVNMEVGRTDAAGEKVASATASREPEGELWQNQGAVEPPGGAVPEHEHEDTSLRRHEEPCTNAPDAASCGHEDHAVDEPCDDADDQAVCVPPPLKNVKEDTYVCASASKITEQAPLTRQLSTRRGSFAELPRLHEERPLDCTFDLTFVLPMGPVGHDFAIQVKKGFGGPESEAPMGATNLEDVLLVPYDADRRMALVTLRQIGPVDALALARQRSQLAPGFASTATSMREDELSVSSTAIVYVVTRAPSVDQAEQQLRPICALEASYSASQAPAPSRFLAVLHDEDMSPKATDRPQLFGDVLQELRRRRVEGQLASAVAFREDSESHRGLVVHIVEALAAQFGRGSPDAKKRQVGPEISGISTMVTTPNSATPVSSYPSSPRNDGAAFSASSTRCSSISVPVLSSPTSGAQSRR